MGTYGDTLSQPIPTVGTSGPTYAQEIDDFLTEVRSRLEQKVPLTSLLPGTLDLANNPLANAQWVSLYDHTTTPSSPVGSLQSYGTNLWWISGSGAVQLTVGNTLNTASLGGITGDYGGANPAQFRYVNADQEFYAYADYSLGNYAKIWALGFDIAATLTGSTRVRLLSTGVGSSYSITMPAALPAATYPLQISSTGQLSAPSTLLMDDYKISPTGNTSGLGFFKILNMAPAVATISVNASERSIASTAINWQYDGPNIPLRLGDRINYAGFYATTHTGTITITLSKFDMTTNAVTTVQSLSSSVAGSHSVTMGISSPVAYTDHTTYFITLTGTASGENISAIYVYYDHP